MFGLFYPEMNERYMPYKSFETIEAAKLYMDAKATYKEIPTNGLDSAAWMNNLSGEILVLRAI